MRLLPFGIYKVVGHSMAPIYTPGALVLGWRWFRQVRPGQIVVINTPERPLVKLVKKVNSEGVWAEGAHAGHSRDSRQLGHFPADAIEAVIVNRIL